MFAASSAACSQVPKGWVTQAALRWVNGCGVVGDRGDRAAPGQHQVLGQRGRPRRTGGEEHLHRLVRQGHRGNQRSSTAAILAGRRASTASAHTGSAAPDRSPGPRSRRTCTRSVPVAGSPVQITATATIGCPCRCAGTNSSGGPLNTTRPEPNSTGASAASRGTGGAISMLRVGRPGQQAAQDQRAHRVQPEFQLR